MAAAAEVAAAAAASTAAPAPAPTADKEEEENAEEDTEEEVVQLGLAVEVEVAAGGAGRLPALAQCNWREWDGGKLGGCPWWLVPRGVPPPAALACRSCGKPSVLLAQLYSPLDAADVGHGAAFHRMLYVFACMDGRCVNRGGSALPARPGAPAVIVLRAPPPRHNPRPAGTQAAPAAGAGQTLPPADPARHPRRGGAPTRAARCKGAHYCGRQHQLLHWSVGHKVECGAAGGAPSRMPPAVGVVANALLREWVVDVEEEPPAAARAAAEAAALPAAVRRAAAAAATAASASASTGAAADGSAADGEEGELSIATLTQRKLASITGAALFDDPYLTYFQRRVACEPSQVVRYCRWPTRVHYPPAPPPPPAAAVADAAAADVPADAAPAAAEPAAAAAPVAVGGAGERPTNEDDEEEEDDDDGEGGAGGGGDDIDLGEEEGDEPIGAPLWIASSHRPAAAPDVPPCGRCGAPRAFEFQIMPQALSYLLPAGAGSTAKDDATLDFGVVAVYTCTRSCAPPALAVAAAPATAAGGAGGTGDASACAYLEECAWVQPSEYADESIAARMERLHARVGGAGGGDGGGEAED